MKTRREELVTSWEDFSAKYTAGNLLNSPTFWSLVMQTIIWALRRAS